MAVRTTSAPAGELVAESAGSTAELHSRSGAHHASLYGGKPMGSFVGYDQVVPTRCGKEAGMKMLRFGQCVHVPALGSPMRYGFFCSLLAGQVNTGKAKKRRQQARYVVLSLCEKETYEEGSRDARTYDMMYNEARLGYKMLCMRNFVWCFSLVHKVRVRGSQGDAAQVALLASARSVLQLPSVAAACKQAERDCPCPAGIVCIAGVDDDAVEADDEVARDDAILAAVILANNSTG